MKESCRNIFAYVKKTPVCRKGHKKLKNKIKFRYVQLSKFCQILNSSRREDDMAVVTVHADCIYFAKSQAAVDLDRFAICICVDDFVDEFQFVNAITSYDTRVNAPFLLEWGSHP